MNKNISKIAIHLSEKVFGWLLALALLLLPLLLNGAAPPFQGKFPAGEEEYCLLFVHIGKKLPDYAETALRQARLFNGSAPIILLASKSAIDGLNKSSFLKEAMITAVSCESLKKIDAHNSFIKNSTLNQNFKEGFWRVTSERFLYLADLMVKYDLKNLFHLEYDNMLYADLSLLLPAFSKNYSNIAATFDNEERCVPGFLYFKDKEGAVDLANYFAAWATSGKNDMELIGQYRCEKGPSAIDFLPIVHARYIMENEHFGIKRKSLKNKYDFCAHIEEFGAIFDAAAIGQYLGGGYSSNKRQKPGFINEEAIFIPSDLSFGWERDESGLFVPFALYSGEKLPIVNLHIHSKNLEPFSSEGAAPLIKKPFGGAKAKREFSRSSNSSLLAFAPPLQGERSSSAPYISGDSFRFASDCAYDELSRELDPLSVEEGSTIFVKADFIGEFFAAIHPQIPNRYLLITHNSDASVPGEYRRLLDDPKIIAWFGQNVEGAPHPKLHPIPIGIANSCWEHGNTALFDAARSHPRKKGRKHLLYMNFASTTCPEERGPLYRQFKDKPFCYRKERTKFTTYLSDLARSKFVLSPRGNGLDTHRTWEALAMGAIPIVRTSPLDPLYSDLPVLIVKEWSEVTPSLLEKSYKEFSKKKYNLDKLAIDYWLEKIESCKNQPPPG